MATNEQDYMPALLAQLREAAPAQAAEILERAAHENPRDPRPLLLLAAQFMQAQQVDRAEGAYLLALQRAPTYAIARFQLGLLQFTSARPVAALATWAPLEELSENDPLRLFKRGLEAMGRDQFEDARKWLLAGIAANTINEPLNRDMQMVIDRMVQMGVFGGEQPAGASAAPAESEGRQHVLLSTYGRKN